MFLSKIKRLALRLTVLGILIIGLVALPVNPAERKAYAAVSCDQCDAQFEACMTECIDYQSACDYLCQFQYNRCYRTCY
jgi:hypothetical protein